MTSKDNRGYGGRTQQALRAEAEEIARERATQPGNDLETMSADEAQQTLHELRVHQIELEMQNEELRRAQAELGAARERYFDIYDLAPVGYCTLSEHGLILEANLTAAILLGVTRDGLVKEPITRFILKEDEDVFYLHCKQLFGSREPLACELRMQKQNGAPFWARLEAVAALDEGGAFFSRVVLSDITGRKQAEEVLRESHEKFKELFEDAPVGYHEIDKKGIIVRVNGTELRMLGFTDVELLEQPVWTIMADQELSRRAVFTKLEGAFEPSLPYERVIRKKDRSTLTVLIEDRILRGGDGSIAGIRSVLQDITELKRAQDQVRRSLEEKDVLLREVHHRVKNNLSVISSLLNLQSSAIQTPAQAMAAFRNSRDRIMSMALVHEELYRSRNYARVDMDEYLSVLTRHLLQAYGSGGDIHLHGEAQGIVMGVDTAIPCGLILSELITNALKYAFPKGGAGDIHVLLRMLDDASFELSVADNGIGLSEGYEARETLGLSLVRMLTEQLEGTMGISVENGTRCRIRFPGGRKHEQTASTHNTL
jgi:PAS domain S-box-containing protein